MLTRVLSTSCGRGAAPYPCVHCHVRLTLQKAFSALVCDDSFEDGSSYLRADYSISCHAANRAGWVLYAVVAICVYPIGIPCMYMAVLWRRRKEINPSGPVRGPGGALIDKDHPRYAYVELDSAPHVCGAPSPLGVVGRLYSHDVREVRVSPRGTSYIDAVLLHRAKNPRLKPITFLYASYEPRSGAGGGGGRSCHAACPCIQPCGGPRGGNNPPPDPPSLRRSPLPCPRHSAWFFEVVELLRKVLLTGFIVLFAAGPSRAPPCVVAAVWGGGLAGAV